MEQDHKLDGELLADQQHGEQEGTASIQPAEHAAKQEEDSPDGAPQELPHSLEQEPLALEPLAESEEPCIDTIEPDQETIERELLEEIRDKGISKLVVDIFEWIETLVLAVACVVLLFTLGARTSQVYGESMLPTLHQKDMLMVSRLLYKPHYGDIVVITKPNYLGETIIKRVIATEGQEVNIDFEQGVVFVNGIALDEPYINEPTYRSFDISFPLIVPKGQVFVMGDNRNKSLDSRSSEIGLVDQNYILGKAFVRFLPFESFGGLY